MLLFQVMDSRYAAAVVIVIFVLGYLRFNFFRKG